MQPWTPQTGGPSPALAAETSRSNFSAELGGTTPHGCVKDDPFWKGDGRKQIAGIGPHDHEGPIHPHTGCTGGGGKAKCSLTAENKALLGF